MSTLLPFAPVAVDQVWSYGPTYHRQDRITILRRGFAGLWIAKEVRSCDERHYTEADIHTISVPTMIQPGQIWEPLTGTIGHTIKVSRCTDGFVAGVWRWEVAQLSSSGAPSGTYGTVTEHTLTTLHALVDPSATIGLSTRQSNGPCNRCGSPALTIFNKVECRTPKCPNYRS